MKRALVILVLAGILALPGFSLAVGPSNGIPTGLAGTSGCTMKHTVRGCAADTEPEAVDPNTTSCLEGETCLNEACCLLDRIYTITDWFFVILLVVAAIFILWGAIEFITSGGDPEKVGSARNKLIWALVGVVVAFISRGLVRLITQIIKQ